MKTHTHTKHRVTEGVFETRVTWHAFFSWKIKKAQFKYISFCHHLSSRSQMTASDCTPTSKEVEMTHLYALDDKIKLKSVRHCGSQIQRTESDAGQSIHSLNCGQYDRNWQTGLQHSGKLIMEPPPPPTLCCKHGQICTRIKSANYSSMQTFYPILRSIYC